MLILEQYDAFIFGEKHLQHSEDERMENRFECCEL